MQPKPPSQLVPLAREAWWTFLARGSSATEPEPPVRRRSRRCQVWLGGAWRIWYQENHAPIELRVKLINAAPEGVMVLSREEVPERIPVLLAFTTDDGEDYVLGGEVRHCTSTVGGYKIGVRLLFSGADPQGN